MRIKPEEIDTLIDGKRYFPGYHMNKKHWFTICLDGSVSTEEIFCRIDESFALARK
ncbi:MAG: MmcQ/YjbR family DNA-binding protein [Desulfovibrio sp.]|nr:MmcQ/YjbR family DNA-binding protein [Desulfovibrio sp.]